MSTLPPNFRQQLLSGPRCLALLLCLYCLLSLYGLGSWGLIETSEARYAEMGREMYLSGDVLHPTILGVRHYHKPPLTYAITAFAYQLFGVSTWSARIFLQIGLWLQLLLVYRIGRLLLPERRTALCAILALGLVRLRARQSSGLSDAGGESSLHFPPDRSGHATPTEKETA